VLFDFAEIVPQLKPSRGSKVIVFGGSYGGMLAASAPLLMLSTDSGAFMELVSGVYKSYGGSCATSIQNAFKYLALLRTTSNKYASISNAFHSCTQFTSEDDIDALVDWLNNNFVSMV
jgi:hypothetical protein